MRYAVVCIKSGFANGLRLYLPSWHWQQNMASLGKGCLPAQPPGRCCHPLVGLAAHGWPSNPLLHCKAMRASRRDARPCCACGVASLCDARSSPPHRWPGVAFEPQAKRCKGCVAPATSFRTPFDKLFLVVCRQTRFLIACQQTR